MTVKELKLILDRLDPNKEIIVENIGFTIKKVCDIDEYTTGLYSDFKNVEDIVVDNYVFMELDYEDN